MDPFTNTNDFIYIYIQGLKPSYSIEYEQNRQKPRGTAENGTRISRFDVEGHIFHWAVTALVLVPLPRHKFIRKGAVCLHLFREWLDTSGRWRALVIL